MCREEAVIGVSTKEARSGRLGKGANARAKPVHSQGGLTLKFELNGILVSTERLLARVGLPAGPDELINHKTLLGFILGAVGAAVGWVLTEPYQEDFSFLRDLLILTAVGSFIWVFVSSLDNIFDGSLRAVFMGLRRTAYVPLMIVVVVLATKLALMGVSHTLQFPSLFLPAPERLLKVFVLDISGSMEGYPLEKLKESVKAYVEVIEKEGRKNVVISLACVAFSDDAKLIEGPTTDYRAFLEKVNNLHAAGLTNMASGLEMAQRMVQDFLKESSGTNVTGATGPKCEVILLSDGKPNRPSKAGEDNYAITTIQTGLTFYESGKIPINAVGAGKDYYRQLMEQISQKTHGRFVAADDIGSLVPVFQQLARDGLTQRRTGEDPGLPFMWRILGWTMIGFVIGVGSALSRRSGKALAMGMIGGLLGGCLGAIFFEVLQLATATLRPSFGAANRLGGFLILGGCVGFCVPFVESVAKAAWLRIIRGLGEGRLIILDRSPMILGRHELIDIPIFGDPLIDLKNLRLEKTGGNLYVETLGPDNLLVRDERVRHGTLAHLDTFTVGDTKFVYLNKREGVAAEKFPEKDRMPGNVLRPRAGGAGAATAQPGVTGRRLPIYIVLDVACFMAGKPVKAVNNGLKELEAALKTHPTALGCTHISVISFGKDAQQLMPLTEAAQFRAPALKASEGTSLGKALTILGQCLERDVRSHAPIHLGDWKPLIFLMLGGEPTDSWQGPAENLRTRAAQKSANIIAVSCNPNVAAGTLRQITKTVLEMPDPNPNEIKALFGWITQSVKVASDSASHQAANGLEGRGAPLPPLPAGIQIAQ